ncbi:MAG: 16S rRNA (cytosine(1402)-N(4))-methyltransferase RsmH [Acholeplasmatales bacterium]|nr:16S rRNA (cytosine(1402)-N(4))-methyltransferase RsmH [Acholeplasmatales bacterium]
MYIHKSVLLNEAIENLNIKEDGIYVDATLGGGGHSKEILKRIPKGHLYCFDQDDYAFLRSKPILDEIGNNYTFIKANFKDLKQKLNELGVEKIDGILYDLGVSSFQLDIPERGFSYNFDAKLDMRMDQTKDFSAYDIVNKYKEEDISKIIFDYGEEKFARSISRNIINKRKEKPIETTFELVDIIKHSMPQKELHKKGHPAKKTFQALRIAVNDELRVFETSINDALDMLNHNGYAVVITFHSLEDRICKKVFKERSTLDILPGLPIVITEEAPFENMTKKVITSSDDELDENNRAHSAKMRVLRRR